MFFDIEVSLKGICIAGNIKNSITIIVDNNRLFALTHTSDKNRGPTNNKTRTCHALRWPSKQVSTFFSTTCTTTAKDERGVGIFFFHTFYVALLNINTRESQLPRRRAAATATMRGARNRVGEGRRCRDGLVSVYFLLNFYFSSTNFCLFLGYQ